MGNLSFYSAMDENRKITDAIKDVDRTLNNATHSRDEIISMRTAIAVLADAVKNQAKLWDEMKDFLRDLENNQL